MAPQLSSNKNKKAFLVLEGDTFFIGHGFGAIAKVSSEDALSTSIVGYLSWAIMAFRLSILNSPMIMEDKVKNAEN